MKDVRTTVCEFQSKKGVGYRLSAAASLDCVYFLIATAALYFWFGDLHRHATPSRAVAAALAFSPLVGSIVLALRGHVLPARLHVVCGGNCAIAALLPLLVSAWVQRPFGIPWWSVARVGSLLALVALIAGLSSLAGAELGGLVHRLQQRQGLERRAAVARIPIDRTRPCVGLRSFRSALGTPILTTAIAACGAIIAALIAKL